MPSKQKSERTPEPEAPDTRPMDTLIGENVMHTLGHPGDLQRLQVKRLWDLHYRVNVFVGPDVTSIKVAHSYFLVADSKGNIITSTPTITKTY